MLLALAACSRGAPQLMNLRQDGEGPDEFSVLPTNPIELPSDMSSLPPPTPGGVNRADPDPEAALAEALGGNINRAGSGSQGLITYAARLGTAADIRNVLATEDLAFRETNRGRLLERWAGNNTYHSAYRVMSLDRYAELARMRAAGIRTPAAPPEEIGNLD